MKTHFIGLLLFFIGLTPLLASPGTTTPYIKVDQFGYLCSSKKVAVIVDPQTGYNSAESFNPGVGANQYQVRRWTDDVPVFTGTLQIWNNGATHTQSGDKGWWFDFSAVTTPGSYYVYDLTNNVGSYRFEIGANVYDDVLKHAMRTYFYQRIGIAKTSANSDPKWTDGAWYTGANQDGAARSRWDKTNPATARDLSGGWFDAGDPNKYTTFAQDVIFDLLEAYRMNPGVFADNYNIPESGNGIPDILDEVKWELDFFKKMQDGTGTNGFFLKVGVDNYNSVSPPSLDTRARYYVPECTSGTLSGCAMFAIGGVVYSSLSDPAMQTYGANLITRAENAWARAVVTTSNFTTFETNCDDQNITAGDADRNVAQQKQSAFIAAVYLYEATGNSIYKTFVENNYASTEPYVSWWWGPYYNGAHLAMLRYASLPGVTSTVANNIRNQKAGQNGVLSINDYNAKTDLYRGYMPDPQYHWGSNSVKAAAGNNNLDFITFNLNPTNHALYREVAEEYLHYFHGQNPQGMVYLSNMYAYGAENSANEIYHMWFDNGTDWDHAINSPKGPAPGYVTGGANKDFSVTTISPPAGQPAQKAYKDWNTGYPENSWEITEPAIYSQSSYIRLLSRVVALNANCGVATVPAAPTGLAATAVSSSQINLTWTDNANNETVYRVERATAAGGPWTEIAANLPSNTTTYSANGLTASTTYHFRVRASNAAGNSDYSNTANATTLAPPTPPAAPTALAATAVSTSQINLTWTDNAGNEDNYRVERATASGGPWTEIAANLAANTTAYSATGLTAATTYYFRVRASNAGGFSAFSNTANATTQTATNVTTNVYTDALQADWADWSWGATRAFGNKNPVKVGSRSIKVNYTATYGGLSLRKGTAVPANNLVEVRFWVYASSVQTMTFFSQSGDNSGSSPNVSFITVANGWKEVVITRAQLGNPTAIKRINLQTGNFLGTFYFDQIRLISSGPPAIPPASATEFGETSERNAETGITGLRVSPNPAAGSTTISFVMEESADDALVQLYDMATGALVQEQRVAVETGKNALQIDLSRHPAGLYSLQLTAGKYRQRARVVLQR